MNDGNSFFRYKDFTNNPEYKNWTTDNQRNKIKNSLRKYLALKGIARSINLSFKRRRNDSGKF